MTTEDTGNVIGIIFPILQEHVQRFFKDKKRVFVKFFGRSAPVGLHLGSKLFFYESGGRREIVGEARIREIGLGTPDDVLSKFGDKLFLSKDELDSYVGDRRTKKILILSLDDVKKYTTPLTLQKPVTMMGQYMTRAMYRALTGEKQSSPS